MGEITEKTTGELTEDLIIVNMALDSLTEARKKDTEYYRSQLAEQTKEKAVAVLAAETLQGEVNSQGVEINSLKEEVARWKKEANNLKKKLESLRNSEKENAK